MFSNPTFTDLEKSIREEFAQFNFPVPEFSNINDTLFVKNLLTQNQCWVGVMYFEPSLREVPDCGYMGSVTTRTDWWFAGVVVYAICKSFGKIIFNDSGAPLGEPGTYTLSEFKKLLDDLRPK